MIPVVIPQTIFSAQLFTALWMFPLVFLIFGVSYLPKRVQKGIAVAVGGAVLLDCCYYSPLCYDWFFYILTPLCWG